jgi:ribosomal subunit interface protein
MRVQVSGKQMAVGEALRTRIETELDSGVSKYFSRATDANVTVAKNGIGCEVDCAVHLSSGISLQAQGHGADAHLAFDDALTKLETRVRRYKRRLKNHHHTNKAPLPAENAAYAVLSPLTDDEEDLEDGAYANGHDPSPLVIAETSKSVLTMPVAMAVMQLDLTENPALLFRNAAHGGLNMVYRRADGNIGWIDPDRA